MAVANGPDRAIVGQVGDADVTEPESLGRYMGLEVPETLEELLVRFRAGDKIPLPNWQIKSNDEHGRVMGLLFLEYADHAVRVKLPPDSALELATKLRTYVQVEGEKFLRAAPMREVLSALSERFELPMDTRVFNENLRRMVAADVDFVDTIELLGLTCICVAFGYREGLSRYAAALRHDQLKQGAPATFNPITIATSRKP